MSKRRRKTRTYRVQGPDGSVRNVYEGGSVRDMMRAREAQWAREIAAGDESPEEAAYRLRQLSVSRGHFGVVGCDEPGCDQPDAYRAVILGKPEWIIGMIERGGWTVPGKWALEGVAGILPGEGYSTRVLVFCDEHGPGEGAFAVQHGFEDAADAFLRAVIEAGPE